MNRTSPTKGRRFSVMPTTLVGRRALRFFGFSLVTWAVAPLGMVLPVYLALVVWGVGILGTVALLFGGYLALTAIIREHERALSLFVVVLAVAWFLLAVVVILASGGEA